MFITLSNQYQNHGRCNLNKKLKKAFIFFDKMSLVGANYVSFIKIFIVKSRTLDIIMIDMITLNKTSCNSYHKDPYFCIFFGSRTN